MAYGNDEWLLEQEEVERAAWDVSPEGRAWRRERELEARRRAEQEREWQVEHPLVWAAWLKVQPSLMPHFGVEYGFKEFLEEVRDPEPGEYDIGPKSGYLLQPGNLTWVTTAAPTGPRPRAPDRDVTHLLTAQLQDLIERLDRIASAHAVVVVKEANTTGGATGQALCQEPGQSEPANVRLTRRPAAETGTLQGGGKDGGDGHLTKNDVARRFRVSPRQVNRWMSMGKLKAFRNGQVVRFILSDVEAFENRFRSGRRAE